jgi:hypothetical protein
MLFRPTALLLIYKNIAMKLDGTTKDHKISNGLSLEDTTYFRKDLNPLSLEEAPAW